MQYSLKHCNIEAGADLTTLDYNRLQAINANWPKFAQLMLHAERHAGPLLLSPLTLREDLLMGLPMLFLGGELGELPMLRRANSPSGRLDLCLWPVPSVKADGSSTHMILLCLGPKGGEIASAMERQAIWGHSVLCTLLSA